ncbi:MAG: HU family DNA-binding protein [Bacteroidaceae bacterium]|nr:HU family DNA-binding protein [Bacteroidaceae bacterium]
MNKTELVAQVAAKAGLSKAAAKAAIDAALEAVTETLVKGDKVALIGFGTLAVADRPAREGVNPATGAKITIAARKVVKFKAGAELAAAVN